MPLALADLPLGGGKAVILGHPCRDKTPDLLHAFGRFVDRLEGRFVTAEDVGMSVADVETVGDATRHVAGLSRARGSSGGQNGLASIIDHLGDGEFPRLRLGIAPLKHELDPAIWPDFVLAPFTGSTRWRVC